MTGLSPAQRVLKRGFDVGLVVLLLVVGSPVMVVAVVAATIDTREWGVFAQQRIGRHGVPFKVFKVRSMRTTPHLTTTVTQSGDPRITPLGRLLRALKIDELPQLINVLRGEMSLVGPRPDVAGWADRLEGDDRVILSVRPGITCPSSLFFCDEEELLASAADPEAYNRDVIWPEKVRMNREYVENWSLGQDVVCIVRTITQALQGGKKVTVHV